MKNATAKTLSRIRGLCLEVPETRERLSHGAPTFFVREKRAFLMVLTNHHGDGRFAIWCAAAQGMQEMLVEGDAGSGRARSPRSTTRSASRLRARAPSASPL